MSSGALNAGDGAARTPAFRCGDEDFTALRALVRKHTGISLSAAKRGSGRRLRIWRNAT
jgi:hypothetical protein